ncbi:MAG: HAD-IC family P-type ATPase, partial [Solirubrobacteraceae bacterium]
EELRGDARATVEFLRREGVSLKVLSGDAPATVAAVAADAGIPIAGEPLDGRALPDDDAELAAALDRAPVVGRISPEDKRRAVAALGAAGHYVGMVGDGVNDVPALKAARLAIAQGSGVQMARSVADIVLVGGDFASVPPMVAQGRQVLRNVQRVAKLFVAKSVFAAILILTLGTMAADYPLLPRHLSLVASLTIGIPAFFLALAPSTGAWRPEGFLRDVARFAIPAGVASAVGVLAGYLLALHALDESVRQSRTVATAVLMVLGLRFVLALEGTPRGARGAAVWLLCAAMAALYALALAIPVVRDFYALSVPRPALWLCAATGSVLGLVAFRVGRRTVGVT